MGLKPALGPINDYLLWYDKLAFCDAHTLLITEGPFDALLMNILGADLGIVATCIFTNTPTERQIGLLHEMLPRFRRKFLMLDNDMVHQSIRLHGELSSLRVKELYLPPGVKDPAKLRREQLKHIFQIS